MGHSWAFSLLLASKAAAWQHHLFTSSITTPHLYGLRFDDEDNTITNIANISAHGGHPWISFSYDKGSIYAGEGDGFASYSVENTTSLIYQKSIKITNECGPGLNGRAPPYVIAELRTPFNVFGAPLGTCGTAMNVSVEGGLEQIVQAYKYDDRSNIQGLTLDPENRYLYSADDGRNGIWTHLVTDQGTVQQVGFTQAPYANSGPKKIVVHPNGRFLYAALAKRNVVAVYAINQGSSSGRTPLSYTGLSYSLVPEGVDTSYFSTDEIYLSADANVLFATSRYKIESAQAAANPPSGYIRGILLTSLAEADLPILGRTVGAGFPIRPLFHMETRTSGGLTNAVSPAPWANEYFALADSQFGIIEIWKMENLANVNYTGALAQDAASPPVGGWVSQSWSPQGTIQTADAGAPARATQPPTQSGAPFGRPAPPAQPTPQPAPQSAPYDPWLPSPKQPAGSELPWQAPPKQGQPPRQPSPSQPKQPKQSQQGGAWPFGGFGGQNQGANNQQPAAAAEEDDDIDRVRSTGAEERNAQEDNSRGPRRGSNTGAIERPAEVEEVDERRGSDQSRNGVRPAEAEETDERRGPRASRPAEVEEDSRRGATAAEAEEDEMARGFGSRGGAQGRRPAEREDEESRGSRGRGRGRGRAAEEDDDDTSRSGGFSGQTRERRSSESSRLAKVLPPHSGRQLQKRQDGPGVAVSIVASWQAPDGFTAEGRLFAKEAAADADTARHVPVKQVAVKPWTGSRKRGADSEEQPGALVAAPAGRGCCGNAVWYD